MSGAFNTSSTDQQKHLQQNQHFFSQQQQHHRINNNRHKAVQKFVGGCDTSESKSTRAGTTNNRQATPGPLTVNSEKDGPEGAIRSKLFFCRPSSLVNLEVNNHFPHNPFPTHSAHFVQHLDDETVKGNNNWLDKRTSVTTSESSNSNNSRHLSSYGQTESDNHHTNHQSQPCPSAQNNRPSIIPSGSRDQAEDAEISQPSTSLTSPLANHYIKEEAAESNKRSEQLPKGGEFAVPAVPSRLKAATVTVLEPKKEERRREQLSPEEEPKASTSAVLEAEANWLTKEEKEGKCGEETEEEPQPSTSTAAEVTCATENSSKSAPAKPFRLAFRVSAEAALKLRRIARNQTRALRRLGINAVHLDQQQFAESNGCCSHSLPNSLSQVRILSRTPSPEITRRETRQQQLFQQNQRLHQLAQQQLALVSQHFRGQSSAESFSPNKVSPLNFVRPVVRLPGSPSVASVSTPTYPFHHPPAVIHQSMDRQLQPGPSTVPVTPAPMNSVAENSPLLVDLLSSNVPPNQSQNQQNSVSTQQNALPTQQRIVGNAPLQQSSSQPVLTPQQRQYQQHLYQQQINQQRVQQIQQQQQQQNAFIFGPGGTSAISGQMNPHQPAIVGATYQPPHPSFMLQPQFAHQQIRPHGTPSGGLSASSHGMVPMASACGMPPPYAMQTQQQSVATISSAKANHHVIEAEEPPKKRKRISKKQQQKEEKEREQQQKQLRVQQEAALVQIQQRQQQQIFFQQRQMAMQQQGMVPLTSPALVGAPQQNYQQHLAQYHQQQHYANHNQSQQSNQSNMFNSPPHGNSLGGHYANPQSTPPQPSPQIYPHLGAAQSAMHYMSPPGMWGTSPQQQNMTEYQQQQSQMAVAGQNPAHPLPTVMHLPSQQQQFRTPGTPGSAATGAMCYGNSPATTTCSASTPFHSPQSQQQQMVGTPGGGQHTPIGGGPTPPYGNSHGSTGSVHQQHQSQRGTPVGSGGSTVEHSRTNTPQQQQQQQQFSLHSVPQHNANNNQSYHQGPPSHQSLQQMSPADFYQQQKSIQTKQMLQQSPIAQQFHPSSTSNSVFPQLSDFVEDGLVDDLVVPSISNEDDFDLDLIEPMRCGDHQQQGYHQQNQQQNIIETNHIKMSAEDKMAAEMEMLPDRSPQIDDKPLSPSKLSETQDRNVTDAIASVMERVAKASSKNARIKTVTHKTTTN
ncbi:hypothetical protein niasHT_001160 [Heterodera trifolii]|uniref:Uncharacterized protein n=1 Tax=Heterodera trifolii TaxID=157864 RepID=A0ABD2LYN9_9BILA